MPAAVLRRIFAEAGVHVYCPTGDNLSANASWVCLHAASAGVKTIRLPRPVPVYDVFGEKLIHERGSEFQVQMRTGETGVWLLSKPEQQ